MSGGVVVCVGEVMACVRAHGRIRQGGRATLSIAGAEGNVAIGLARLGHPAAVVSAVGTDEIGELVVRSLRAEGVDTTGVHRDPDRPTGVMLREQRTADAVHVDYARRGSAASALGPADVEEVLDLFRAGPGVRHLHVSGVTWAIGAGSAAEAALTRAEALGVPTSIDVNHRGRLWSAAAAAATLGPWLGRVDVVFATDDELKLVGPPRSDTEVVVTRGAGGAEIRAGGHTVRVAARQVRVRDVVGAGDAFVAGYLSARLDGGDVDERLGRGTDVAAVAVGSEGDWEGMPTRDELPNLFGDHGGTIR